MPWVFLPRSEGAVTVEDSFQLCTIEDRKENAQHRTREGGRDMTWKKQTMERPPITEFHLRKMVEENRGADPSATRCLIGMILRGDTVEISDLEDDAAEDPEGDSPSIIGRVLSSLPGMRGERTGNGGSIPGAVAEDSEAD